LIDSRTVAGRSAQGDGHARNTGFAGILYAVAVQIIPYKIAEAGGLEKTSVPSQVIFTRNQAGVHGHKRHRIHIAVHGIVGALVFRCHRVAAWDRESDFIGTRFQIREEVQTARVGAHRLIDWCAVAGGAGQGRLNAGDTGFAHILKAIAVEVVPHIVAERSGLEEAGVHRAVVIVGDERVIAGHAGHFTRVAVYGVIRALVGCGSTISGWFCESYFISTWFQVGEQVQARSIGCGVQIDWLTIARGTAQVDGYAGNTRFAGILFAVAVQVVPNEIAEFGGAEVACVPSQVVFT